MSDCYYESPKTKSICKLCGDQTYHKKDGSSRPIPWYYKVFEKNDQFRGNDSYLGRICKACIKAGRLPEMGVVPVQPAGEHDWVNQLSDDWQNCSKCDAIKQVTGNKPCSGKRAKATLRESSPQLSQANDEQRARELVDVESAVIDAIIEEYGSPMRKFGPGFERELDKAKIDRIARKVMALLARTGQERETAGRIDEHKQLTAITKQALKALPEIAPYAFMTEVNEWQKRRIAELEAALRKQAEGANHESQD